MKVDQAAIIWTMGIMIVGAGFASFPPQAEQSSEAPSTGISRSGQMAQQGIAKIQGINTFENNDLVSKSVDTLTNEVTISAWVEPNYGDLSDEYTILSKENSFILSINNVLPPKYVAKLAIYDGMRWTEITSTTSIQGLSHIVGVINGNMVLLYVNGALEQQIQMENVFVVDSGRLDIREAELSHSEANVVVGAYVSTARHSSGDVLNKFSGIVHDVKIYDDEALSGQQIEELYWTEFSDISQ
ncbi:LamG-like jellyroll fold domain-containing protein [Candidatus Nitrosotenuis cloacae]|uniref:LamG-like jellyroll fold domain-containing protein n=1 Tax=Candidatus Nitrosotenuis cloacae TaxID=1603555 RepID=A0A3G1B3A1_9ARCH|nr:LamG-like jellyroll fold domain-containing protein [Candidatus Nitrosotenuis cloacae]AJZ76229.1 hypothetical protein SU86_007485 [Candidatus Nitrosotenuis cloacae]